MDLTNNNGFTATVELLEAIYTNPAFPLKTPVLNGSLQSTGKSRADLWALAALVAVESTIDLNNLACDNPSDPWITKLDQCVREKPGPCHVTLPRSLKFMTGRRDCITNKPKPYIAAKSERHPSSQTDGKGTVEFFRRDFGFTGKEAVTIMGAHTLGRFHVQLSGFRYTWTFKNEKLFNNQYYRNIVGKPDWYYEHGPGKCDYRGDAYGNKGKARWMPHVRLDSKDGGPVQWIQEKLVCPDCRKGKGECCKAGVVPAGGFCKPDNNRDPGSILPAADDNVNAGCEKYRFIIGVDEAATSSEIGLYLDFKVHDGMPYGCPGLEAFNATMWRKYKYPYQWSRRDGRVAEIACAREAPLHQVFEEYADDQQKWVTDFVPTFEKMLSNGYAKDELVQGPEISKDVKCPRVDVYSYHKFWSCYSTLDLSPPLLLVSALSKTKPMVLELDMKTGKPQMWAQSGAENQQWRWTKDKTQLINVWNEMPLAIAGQGIWDFVDGWMYATDVPGKVIDRAWAQTNGVHATVYKKHRGKNQQWEIIYDFEMIDQ